MHGVGRRGWPLLLVALVGCQEPVVEGPVADRGLGEDHQFVELRLIGDADMRLESTTSIRASLYYSECLSDFYRESPEWGYAGEQGGPVFDQAIDEGLCPPLDPWSADCEVAGIRQDMHGDDQLIVDYEIRGELSDRTVLRIGPVPDPELVGCHDNQPLFMGHVLLSGVSSTDEALWGTPLTRVSSEQRRPFEVSVDVP